MTALDLSTSAVLLRAANLITTNGLSKNDFVNHDGAYCSAGAIANACALDPTDWDDLTDPAIDDIPLDEREDWRAARTAALAALRTLVGHTDSDARPEEMTRRELIEIISGWNDADERTADQVATAMRDAARQEAARA